MEFLAIAGASYLLVILIRLCCIPLTWSAGFLLAGPSGVLC